MQIVIIFIVVCVILFFIMPLPKPKKYWDQIHEFCPSCGPDAKKGEYKSVINGNISEICLRCNTILGLYREVSS